MAQIRKYDDYDGQFTGRDDEASGGLYDNAYRVVESLTRDSELSSLDCEDEV